jgi:hypothetical protein
METKIVETAPIRTRVLDVRVTRLSQLARHSASRPETAEATTVPVADFQSSI